MHQLKYKIKTAEKILTQVNFKQCDSSATVLAQYLYRAKFNDFTVIDFRLHKI